MTQKIDGCREIVEGNGQETIIVIPGNYSLRAIFCMQLK